MFIYCRKGGEGDIMGRYNHKIYHGTGVLKQTLRRTKPKEGNDRVNKYDIYKSDDGYRIAYEIYIDEPVTESSPWFKTKESAEKHVALYKEREELNKRIEKIATNSNYNNIEENIRPHLMEIEVITKQMDNLVNA
jgi:hypothetical protein